MSRPILTLGPSDWLKGLSASAHTERGGIMLSATGVTPIYNAGGTADTQNGLLQGGPAPTEFTGLSDIPIASVAGYETDNVPYLFFMGNAGHFYKKPLGSGAVSDLRSGTPITNPANGMTIWAPRGGTLTLYYWQKQQIGTWGMSTSAYPAAWDDDGTDYLGLSNIVHHPVDQFVGNVYFGNNSTVGALLDNGSSGVTFNDSVFDIPSHQRIFAIANDGQYLVVSATDNLNGDNRFAVNTIYFWDTNASSWAQEYVIRDPFIFALKRLGNAVYAFGQYGIYEVTFQGGVKTLLRRSIGFGTTADFATTGMGPSRATIYGDALIWGTDTTIDTLGSISPDLPPAYYKSFKVPSGGTPSIIATLFDPGRVYMGSDDSKLYAFDFNGTTRETSVSAQTIYFPFKQKTLVNRIDVIFGEPLTTSDAFDVDTKIDEDTSAVDFGAASFTSDGAIRRKTMYSNAGVQVDTQLSLVLNWTAGAVKVKNIVVYGTPMTP